MLTHVAYVFFTYIQYTAASEAVAYRWLTPNHLPPAHWLAIGTQRYYCCLPPTDLRACMQHMLLAVLTSTRGENHPSSKGAPGKVRA